MTFALYTEELNLVCAIAEEEADDELRKLEISSVLDSSSIQRPRSSKEEHNNAAVAKATKTEGGGSFVLGSWASHWHELYAVFHLAGPTIILQMSAVLPGFATASYIGRNLDAVHLDGFALASLTINLFTLSILQGLYSASDTLSPQAYGAGNFAEVGHLAVRGFCGSLLITLPTLSIMAVYMPRLLLAVGIEAEIASYAWHWYLVTIVGVPCTALYQVTWKFLSAQNVMNPLVVCSMLSSGIVLPISLFGFGSRYGFLGTALANVVVQIASVALLFAYLTTFRPHNPSTWPGLSRAIPQALQWKPFSEYMALGLGGMLASSEWIYWESLSLLIGTFGVIPLSVHTIPTQIVTVFFMLPLGLGIAVSIRLGATLPVSVARARQVVVDCLVFGLVVFGALSILMYRHRYFIFQFFTSSELVLGGCDEIWWKVCLYMFLLSTFGILMGVCVGLGMQWTLGITAIVVLWIFGLPASYYLSAYRGGGLAAAWTTIWPPYIIINFILVAAIVRADWGAIAKGIRIREGAELMLRRPSTRSESQPLLDSSTSTTIHHSNVRYGGNNDATNRACSDW